MASHHDVLQLTNLIHRALHFLDEGNGEGMANLFVDDGTLILEKVGKQGMVVFVWDD
jgi:hypothetical protein